MNVTDQFLSEHDATAWTLVRPTGPPTRRTYREVNEDVRRLSAGFRHLGVRQNDRVLVLATTTLEVLEIILATMRIGATAISQTPMTGESTHLAIVRSARPVCCVFDDPLSPGVEAELRRGGCRLISLRKTAPPHVLLLSRVLSDAVDTDARAEVAPDQEALIIYSSGSEGAPKGIRMTHQDVQIFFEFHDFMHSQYAEPDEPGYPRSPFISVLPLNHLAGIGMCFNGLMKHRPTYLMTYFLPAVYVRTFKECHSSVVMLVPSMYTKLMEDPTFDTTDWSAVRYCITIGEPCSVALAELIASRFSATVVNAHGLSECFTGIGHSKAALMRGNIPHGSSGKHLFGEIKLVDAAGRENRDRGELWLRNKSVRACYTSAELNAERLLDGWFATRDLFERDKDGYLYPCGRADDMFICNGRNIYPVEIESVLARHPAVQQVCAAPVQTREARSIPAALIVSRREITEIELIDFAARHGASHAVPQLIVFADRMPEVGTGKVNRREVQRQLQSVQDDLSAPARLTM